MPQLVEGLPDAAALPVARVASPGSNWDDEVQAVPIIQLNLIDPKRADRPVYASTIYGFWCRGCRTGPVWKSDRESGAPEGLVDHINACWAAGNLKHNVINSFMLWIDVVIVICAFSIFITGCEESEFGCFDEGRSFAFSVAGIVAAPSAVLLAGTVNLGVAQCMFAWRLRKLEAFCNRQLRELQLVGSGAAPAPAPASAPASASADAQPQPQSQHQQQQQSRQQWKWRVHVEERVGRTVVPLPSSASSSAGSRSSAGGSHSHSHSHSHHSRSRSSGGSRQRRVVVRDHARPVIYLRATPVHQLQQAQPLQPESISGKDDGMEKLLV